MEYKDYIETTIVLYGDFDIQDNSQWEESFTETLTYKTIANGKNGSGP